MNKDKDINFRLTGLDFEYLRKVAEKQHTTISALLRQLIKQAKEKVEKEAK